MRTTPSFLAILAPSLALGASLAACAPKAKVAPGAVVEGFYAQLLSLPISGAPDPAPVARIAARRLTSWVITDVDLADGGPRATDRAPAGVARSECQA